MKKVAVVTGTRAEYGILYPVMKAIERHPKLNLSLLVTGMHLAHEFGYTVQEIEKDGFPIDARVEMLLSGDTGSAMAKSLGIGIIGMTQALEQVKPDVVTVLGDRGEALAAVIAAAHMNIAVAHIHGGDVTTGADIDEPIRHAITRFAHLHFPTSPQDAERLVRMGEDPRRIHIVGPLGIYAMSRDSFIPKARLCKLLGLDKDKPVVLVVQHPVTTQVDKAADQMRETLKAIVELKEQTVVIYPNADAGGRRMIEVIKEYEGYPFIKTFKSLPYLTFVSLMRIAGVIAGNSSSAIFESPLFGIPAVNIGTRQKGRQRGNNVIDSPHSRTAIAKAIRYALFDNEFRKKARKSTNPFDIDIKGAEKIADVLSRLETTDALLQKRLTY